MNKRKKIIFSLGVCVLMLISITAIISKAASDIIKLEVKLELADTATEYYSNDDIKLNCSITPSTFTIPKNEFNSNVENEIVFVIDATGEDNSNRLGELKAKLIETVEEIKDKENTKIGIVAYGRESKVYTEKFIDVNDSKALISAINGIGVMGTGETNTGAAIRKAGYLLKKVSKNNTANKNIILITSKSPNIYSVSNYANKEYYVDLTKNDNDNRYEGYPEAMEYCEKIGEVIRDNDINCYTMYYEYYPNNNCENDINTIHGYLSDDEKAYFKTNNDTIEKNISSIFNNIKSNNYIVENIKFKYEFQNGFYIKNDIKDNIQPILYKGTDDGQGNLVFTADQLNVELIVKSSHVGENLNIGKIEVTYNDYLGEEISCYSNDVQVTLKEEKVDNNKLRILEIQPANSFTIKNQNDFAVGIQEFNYEYNGQEYDIVLEHISMPEFIGKVQQLNGYYDVIVIGRNISNIAWPYRDYSQIDLSKDTEDGYMENDITIKKATEIVSYINSGQLVYYNNAISELINSNLYKELCIKVDNKNNFIKYDNEAQINLVNILNQYFTDNISKRPAIGLLKPLGDSKGDKSGSIEKRQMAFEIDIPQEAGTVDAKIYLDINGDGLFKENECYKTVQKVSPQDKYNISCDIDVMFVGFLQWKVEIIQTNGVKSYITGDIYFKSLVEGEKKKVRALQLIPDGNNLSLSTDGTGEIQKLMSSLDDYDMSIIEMNYSEFQEYLEKGNSLNGNYDMLILGFVDLYGYIVNKEVTEDIIKEIKEFISSGQSVMFTHDTMRDWPENELPEELTIYFRDYVGQARFVDNHRKANDNTYEETDLVKEYNIDANEYKEKKIPHIDLGDNNGKILGRILGRVDYNKGYTTTTEIYQTNSALITSYPYDINKENISNDFTVARTHTLYFQLNFEDEDVVPWYNLNMQNPGRINCYDSRNYYYTYSKGNITFSGAGHSNEYSRNELKLFVNTIVKAERGANHAPTISSNIVESGNEYDLEVSISEDFNFTTIVKDSDNDRVDVNIYVDGKSVESVEKIEQGTPVSTIIDKSYLTEKENEIINIRVEANDIRGAKAYKEYRIKPTKIPQIQITNTEGKGLVGDDIEIAVKLEKMFEESSNPRITDVSLKLENNELLEIVEEKGISEVKFSNNIYNCSFVVKSKIQGSAFVNAVVEYKVDGKKVVKKVSIPIITKRGSVEINIYNEVNELLLKNFTGTLYKDGDMLSSGSLEKGYFSWPSPQDEFLTSSDKYYVKIDDLDDYYVYSYEILYINSNTINLVDTDITKEFSLNYDNPQIIINYLITNIHHGLFEGIDQGNISIDEENNKEFEAETNINFAAKFSIASNKEVSLTLDSKGEINGVPKIYKLVDGKLEELNGKETPMKKISNNQYDYVLEGISDNTSIVILYGYILKNGNDNDKFTNRITVSKVSKDASVKLKKSNEENKKTEESLPDLF